MMLRGAISGFGEVAAQAHLAGWRTRPEVNIVAIHDPVSERRDHAMRLIQNIRVYDDLELMLDGERLDFVDVASPPAYHAATARMALAAGAHVLVEKPLCLAADEFESLRAAASSRGRVLMCVHNWKYAATYRLAHDLIGAGRLGEIRYVALDRLRTAPAGFGIGASGRWRLGAASGGGILVDHGWHVFYLMRWLMGGAGPGRNRGVHGRRRGGAGRGRGRRQGDFSRRQDCLRPSELAFTGQAHARDDLRQRSGARNRRRPRSADRAVGPLG